jgi:hypothetical protein
VRARLYGAALVIALGIESIDPRRTPEARDRTRALSRAWVSALRGAS